MEKYVVPQVVDPIWITITSTPRSELITDSLAEQVPGPVSTNTRERPSEGSGWPWVTDEKLSPTLMNGSGEIGCPVTGLKPGYFSLKVSCSNVFPAVRAGPAIMNASSLAMSRNPPPL